MDRACPTPASCWYMSRSKIPNGLKFHQLAATTCETRNKRHRTIRDTVVVSPAVK